MEVPPLPGRQEVSNACKEAAAREHVEPSAVEKDLHLTRLLWALAEELGDAALLKGGTCLAKVDLGYHRMSEDVDLVLPWDGGLKNKGMNARQTNKVRDALASLAPKLGMTLAQPDGQSSEKRAHVIWEVTYEGEFPPFIIAVEASMRPVFLENRKVPMRMLLKGPIADGLAKAFTWALHADEVRAEKVRAAFTREEREVRDFYDLDLLRRNGADFTSEPFVALVDKKLAEWPTDALARQPARFGLDDDDIKQLIADVDTRLRSVVRTNEPPFDLKAMLKAFDVLWRKG